MEIPVYLFTGFLESGKTRFIQETLQDPRFNDGTKTLLLVCEEGFEEYDTDSFSDRDAVVVHFLQEENAISPLKLGGLVRRSKAERVLIEYNGMWKISTLIKNLPEEWIVYQNFLFVDSTTFLDYNKNLRNLVVDKLEVCELCVFNRFLPQYDKMLFHTLVRASNRKTDIAYESPDGSVEYDDMSDPLPFDVQADFIPIEDQDYAEWYRDLSEQLHVYDQKTVCFLCKVNSPAANRDSCVVGRPLMTCCEDDIRFAGLVCRFLECEMPQTGTWIRLTAKITLKKHKLYHRLGPVLEAIAFDEVAAPENGVASFL